MNLLRKLFYIDLKKQVYLLLNIQIQNQLEKIK